MAVPTKEILVLVGLPFSGKTTYSKTLANGDTEIISRDHILEEINADESLRISLAEYAKQIGKSWNDVVTEEYVRQVKQKIEQSTARTLVIDGTHLGVASRSFVASFPEYHPTAVVFSPSPEICLQRLAQANLSGIRSTVTPDLITNLHKLYIPPTKEEGFFEIRLVEAGGE